MYFHQSLWRVASVVETSNITVQKYRNIGATYIDIAFPYKEATIDA